MRTFILRSRKVTTQWQELSSHIGAKGHVEIIAHTIMNAFFISNNFRTDVDVYIVLDSAEFPRTIHLNGNEGLSIDGFHEQAIINLLINIFKKSVNLQKNGILTIAPGIKLYGFGFEKLIDQLITTRCIYLLSPKGNDIRTQNIAENPVFILSDHLSMPKNSIKSFTRRGLKMLSLGKKMLFASQCVVLINHELDR